ncbi:MAG: hypothetical protein H6581_24970 [Bacteroidia bacterium]|nr:hypothetical protein [Bacteroidia bacterium]
MRNHLLLLCLGLMLSLFSCQNTPGENEKTENSTENPSEASQNPVDGDETLPQVFDRAAEVRDGWNKALNERNWDQLSSFYAKEVWLYGQKNSREQVLKGKKEYLEKVPDFQQSLEKTDFEATQIERKGIPTTRVTFSKTTETAGKKTTVMAYLDLQKQENTWKIVAESDFTTDRSLFERAEGMLPSEGNNCFAKEEIEDARGGIEDRETMDNSSWLEFTWEKGQITSGRLSYRGGQIHSETVYLIKSAKMEAKNSFMLSCQMYDEIQEMEVGNPVGIEIKLLERDVPMAVILRSDGIFETVDFFLQQECH